MYLIFDVPVLNLEAFGQGLGFSRCSDVACFLKVLELWVVGLRTLREARSNFLIAELIS
jgi:hypothetical protein